MKAYLVGGAVRDHLLHYPVKEKDWVVIGSTPAEMLKQGFQQVGKDFPVFLHPKTREEYALARTERKSGLGYYGFECDFNPHVSLEDDLRRRDLTINAMAMDENQRIIDPYGGQTDLANKVLRHVSEAFIEDPVRVLRIARFAARYHQLGFTLAPETRYLMYQMVKRGELNHLVAERVWQELEASLHEKNPEIFIQTLRSCGALAIIFPEIDALFGVPNPPQYHAEIDSGVHTLLVVQAAVKLSADPMVRFAALVHDLGKAKTPMQTWPSHHQHEITGVEPIEQLAERLRIPADYRKLATLVARIHLVIHRFFELKASTIVKTLEQMDVFRQPQRLQQVLLVCESDAQGRLRQVDYKQREYWLKAFYACTDISSKTIVAEGYQGAAIKEQLHQRRVNHINHLLDVWKKA